MLQGNDRRRAIIATADGLVVLVIVVVLAWAAAVVVGQRDHDGEAADVASWAHELNVDRVSWPEELREAVPPLLDGGVVPVLVDPQTPVQQFAVTGTELVVTSASVAPVEGTVESRSFGDLSAHRIDLESAASVPLEVGETITEQISRPYRYAPLRPSAVAAPAEPFERELFLAPGRYRLEVESFIGVDQDAYQATLQVALEFAEGGSVNRRARIGQVVEEPLVFDIVVPNWAPPQVLLQIGVAGRSGSASAMIHAWSVTRTADL